MIKFRIVYMKKWLFIILIVSSIFSSFSIASAEEKLDINFFYSEICPHCTVEENFLDEIEKRYPEVKINRYLFNSPIGQRKLVDLCKKCNAERYIGLIPLTFIGQEIFIGFDNPEGIGREIEESIKRQLKDIEKSTDSSQEVKRVNLPIIGSLDIGKYSLPIQAILLGFFDGFNVCSLGALILILGLVLALRSKSKILLFGGIFIATTAVIYGLLIVLWYQLFVFLAPYLRIMKILVGCLGIGGGVYFLKEFIRFKKYGLTCEAGGKGIVSKFSSKIQSTLQESGNTLLVIGSVLLFAGMITIVEFPCSAVVPVFFAGILAKSQIPTFFYLLYIALFVLFYMLDEIIIFLVAFFTMTIKLTSTKFFIWITLIEAIILFLLGFYYLIGF